MNIVLSANIFSMYHQGGIYTTENKTQSTMKNASHIVRVIMYEKYINCFC